jgi:hypothetical protein
MPRGVVIWFDQRAGEGRIRRDGREYPVTSPEIEPVARVPLARVHFDIKRREGVDWAVNVTLRRGTRGAPRHLRFGDLAGAHHPDEKGHHPLSDSRTAADWSFEGHPVQLIEEWARMVYRKEFPTLRLLYAPEAILHIGAEAVSGRDAIIERMREMLSGSPTQSSTISGHDDVIGVELEVDDRRFRFECKVAHGRITEQWIAKG